MGKKITLFFDAVINLFLGIILLVFDSSLAEFFGVPYSNTNFYPNILGGIFIGITIALVLEALRKNESEFIGLGLLGAICINICGGLVLVFWLLFGDLDLPLRGEILLWSLGIMLVILSCFELVISIRITPHTI